jgi:hypothetical protein
MIVMAINRVLVPPPCLPDDGAVCSPRQALRRIVIQTRHALPIIFLSRTPSLQSNVSRHVFLARIATRATAHARP